MKPIGEYSNAAELRQVMANARRLGNDHAYWEAFRRLCIISGKDDPDPLLREFQYTLAAYEELLTTKNNRKTIAARTRQKLARKGVIQCLEDWAIQKTSDGLELLVSKGLFELTGEYLVVKYAKRFSRTAVDEAQRKLKELGYSGITPV